MFDHGSYPTDNPMPPDEPAILGPVFARHGYVFLFRQGIGLSTGECIADGDQMARAMVQCHFRSGDSRQLIPLRISRGSSRCRRASW
jgi:hypothetical protein